MDVNPRGRSFFIVRICVKFADAVYQKALTIVQLVMTTCVKPYQDSSNWLLKQVKLLRSFIIRKCEQANPVDHWGLAEFNAYLPQWPLICTLECDTMSHS